MNMSTHALLAIMETDGSIKAVYLHNSGSLRYAGNTLLTYYRDPSKVRALIELGDLSCLGKTIGEKVDFDAYISTSNYINGTQCLAYCRDRGEEFQQFSIKNMDVLKRRLWDEFDFIYIYDVNKEMWLYTHRPHKAYKGKDIMPLEAAMALYKANELFEEEV